MIGNAVLYGYDGVSECFCENGSVLVKNGIIEDIGMTDVLKAEHPETRYIDAGGRMLLSGFVNAHHHLYSFFAAGLKPHKAPGTFPEILENLWWPLDRALDEESIYYSSLMGALESVSFGVTTVFDHHASMNSVRGSLELIKKAFEKVGLRGILCFETSDRSGDATSHIEENVSFYEANKGNPKMKGMFGLHANMTLSEGTLGLIKEARSFDMPVHIHCGESYEDIAYCMNSGYLGAVDRLAAFDLITPNSILAHCVHVSERDRAIIDEIRPFIVTNPESNANNRVGKFNRSNIPRHLLGTDGMSGDMISSLRAYCMLGDGAREPFSRMGSIFFNNMSELAGRFFPGCGTLKKGAAADITVLDYIPIGHIECSNVLGHILYGAKTGRSWLTAVDGKVVWHDGKYPDMDIASLMEESAAAACKLHRRFMDLKC